MGEKTILLENKKKFFTYFIARRLIECPSCGLLQIRPIIQQGEKMSCCRCHKELLRHPLSKKWSFPFAFTISSVILYIVMISFPLLSIDLYGRTNQLGVFKGTVEFINQGWNAVGILVGLVVTFFPMLVIGLMVLILYFSRKKKLPSFFPKLLMSYQTLRPWSMIEVYILGVFVAYTKLIDMAHVELQISLYAIVLLMITMAVTDGCVDFAEFWSRCSLSNKKFYSELDINSQGKKWLEVKNNNAFVSCECCQLVILADTSQAIALLKRCPRCGKKLHRRKPNSLSRSMSLLIAALIFYIPANLYPIMHTTMMGKESNHRIFGGVLELWDNQMIPLALLVFFASILVPVLKISGLSVMIGASLFKSKRFLLERSRLFQIICWVGRWSMIDVFMISILIALIKFSSLATVKADLGIVMFAAVVVLTIFAADVFDPRLMWDYAGLNGMVFKKSKNV
ncbi:Intermembrane transport protein PqiA [Commensalibacter sp. Nvir]|nr:Intermembrane transport protein PqiA [Commensalibacter sp. Nvir]